MPHNVEKSSASTGDYWPKAPLGSFSAAIVLLCCSENNEGLNLGAPGAAAGRPQDSRTLHPWREEMARGCSPSGLHLQAAPP